MNNTIWFKDLGFYSNPFSIKPAAFHDQVLGYDKVVDEISQGILNNKVVVLQGAYGNGKSTILRRILNDFGGKKQVIYYSCNRADGRLNVKELLNGRYGFLGKLFDMKPKDMILLLDEAQTLGPKDYERIESYCQEGYFTSVVLVGNQMDMKGLPHQWKSRLHEVALNALNDTVAVHIVRKRIGDLMLLPDDMISEVYKISDNNVRLLLKNSEEVCKRAVETGRKKVSIEFLRQVFPSLNEKKEDTKTTENVAEPKPEKHAPVAEKPKVEKKETKKEEKKVAEAPPKKVHVYKPEEYKSKMQHSAEELLNSPTEEIFGDEQYY